MLPLPKNNQPTEVTPKSTPETELEFVWRAFSNLNEWVRFSDTKAAVVITADGVIVAGIATWLSSSHTASLYHPLIIVWLSSIIIAAFYSAAYALASISPRLIPDKVVLKVMQRIKKFFKNWFSKFRKTSADVEVVEDAGQSSELSSSLVFYMDIDREFPTSNAFLSKLRAALAEPDRAVTEIGQQVWANSKVAAAKYKAVGKAFKGLSFAIYIIFIGVLAIAVLRLKSVM